VIGTIRLLDLLSDGSRLSSFICACTFEVYGAPENTPVSEEHPTRPLGYYAASKLAGEKYVELFSAAQGVPACSLRLPAIYGPGDPERFYMLFKWAARGWFPMFGDGRTLYHPLYIDNLVDAFLQCLDEHRLTGRSYLIADEQYWTIEELARKVGQAIGKDIRIRHFPVLPVVALGHVVEKACRPFGITPPIFPRRVDWYRQDRAFDVTRAREDLGYAPRVGIDEGLKRTGEWYRAQGLL